MGYQLRYERRAKRELDACCHTYGPTLCGELQQWLRELAEEATLGKWLLSSDLNEILESVIRDGDLSPGSWGESWRRFLRASALEKVQALYVAVTRFKPPWQARAGFRSFLVLNIFSAEVTVVYQLDNVRKEMIVRMFIGLPGQ